MTRHLFFAITLIGTGVLLNSPAEAVTAARCEDQAANCVGGCANPNGVVVLPLVEDRPVTLPLAS